MKKILIVLMFLFAFNDVYAGEINACHYLIQRGDSLYSIAKKNKVSFLTILRLNSDLKEASYSDLVKEANGKKLKPGKEVKLPCQGNASGNSVVKTEIAESSQDEKAVRSTLSNIRNVSLNKLIVNQKQEAIDLQKAVRECHSNRVCLKMSQLALASKSNFPEKYQVKFFETFRKNNKNCILGLNTRTNEVVCYYKELASKREKYKSFYAIFTSKEIKKLKEKAQKVEKSQASQDVNLDNNDQLVNITSNTVKPSIEAYLGVYSNKKANWNGKGGNLTAQYWINNSSGLGINVNKYEGNSNAFRLRQKEIGVDFLGRTRKDSNSEVVVSAGFSKVVVRGRSKDALYNMEERSSKGRIGASGYYKADETRTDAWSSVSQVINSRCSHSYEGVALSDYKGQGGLITGGISVVQKVSDALAIGANVQGFRSTSAGGGSNQIGFGPTIAFVNERFDPIISANITALGNMGKGPSVFIDGNQFLQAVKTSGITDWTESRDEDSTSKISSEKVIDESEKVKSKTAQTVQGGANLATSYNGNVEAVNQVMTPSEKHAQAKAVLTGIIEDEKLSGELDLSCQLTGNEVSRPCPLPEVALW